MDWWNGKYAFRKGFAVNNTVSSPFPAGHPITVTLGYDVLSEPKVRADFKDLEVVYVDMSTSTPAFIRIPRFIEFTSANLEITFDAVDSINVQSSDDTYYFTYPAGNSLLTADDCSYFIYYGNFALNNVSTLPTLYTPASWPVQVARDGLGVAFKKPNESWDDGVSLVDGAEATFSFYGEKVRLLSSKGPSYGIAEIAVDNDTWEDVSLYADDDTGPVVVFAKTNLIGGWHTLKIRASGRKSPKSSDAKINIGQFEYYRSIDFDTSGEEINPNLFWVSYVVGGIEQ